MLVDVCFSCTVDGVCWHRCCPCRLIVYRSLALGVQWHLVTASYAPARPPQIVAATGSGVASFGLTKQGELLAWGTSKRGQLGLGPGVTKAEQPQQLRLPAAAVQVSAGWGHAAALLGEALPLVACSGMLFAVYCTAVLHDGT